MKLVAGHADRKLHGQRLKHVAGKQRQLIVNRVVSKMIRHLMSGEAARGQEKVDLYFKLSIKKKEDLVDPLNLPVKKRIDNV